jgi:hypothetical protein
MLSRRAFFKVVLILGVALAAGQGQVRAGSGEPGPGPVACGGLPRRFPFAMPERTVHRYYFPIAGQGGQ